MKIIMYSFFVLFFVNGLNKCDHENHDQDFVNLGDTIELPINEVVKFKSENLEIKFESNSDSRCPLNVNCIQAGKAKIVLKITKDGNAQTLNLESKGLCQAEDGSCGSEGAAHGYTVKLINVYPYPTEPKTNEAGAVYIKMIVSK